MGYSKTQIFEALANPKTERLRVVDNKTIVECDDPDDPEDPDFVMPFDRWLLVTIELEGKPKFK